MKYSASRNIPVPVQNWEGLLHGNDGCGDGHACGVGVVDAKEGRKVVREGRKVVREGRKVAKEGRW